MNFKLIRKNRFYLSLFLLLFLLAVLIRLKLSFFSDHKFLFLPEELNIFKGSGYLDPYQLENNPLNIIKESWSRGISFLYACFLNLIMRFTPNIKALRLVSLVPSILTLIASIFFSHKLCNFAKINTKTSKFILFLTLAIYSLLHLNILDSIKVSSNSLSHFCILMAYIFFFNYDEEKSPSNILNLNLFAILAALLNNSMILTALSLYMSLGLTWYRKRKSEEQEPISAINILTFLTITIISAMSLSAEKLSFNLYRPFEILFKSPLAADSIITINTTSIFFLLYLYGLYSCLKNRRYSLFLLSFIPLLSTIYEPYQLLAAKFLPSALIAIFIAINALLENKSKILSRFIMLLLIISFLVSQGVFKIPANYIEKYTKLSQNSVNVQRNQDIFKYLHEHKKSFLIVNQDIKESFFLSVPLARLNTTLLCRGSKPCLKKNRVLDFKPFLKSYCTYTPNSLKQDGLNCDLPKIKQSTLVVIEKNQALADLLSKEVQEKIKFRPRKTVFYDDWFFIMFRDNH